ncbi:MAG: hypothetical protein NVSMB19_18670 [Vulcanimicrobiaceae bacterium]
MNAFARAARGWLALAAFAGGTLGIGSGAFAQPGGDAPRQDFGRPPAGEIPILFNDHHVYARPDRLKQGRVLTAIVRNNTILVPLRSMFEQTGATVAFDPSTRTVDVSKPGADVKVTVGKAWVVINGDERPLDVPPIVYKGAILVPLRVISEGMGAFVQWVPEKRLVSVRYVEAIPPAPPDATPAPTPRPARPVPTPVATPSAQPAAVAAVPQAYRRYVAGDYLIAPKIYNELSAGNTGSRSFEVKGAVEFPLFGPTWELGANYRHVLYPHYANRGLANCTAGTPGCNTVVGTDPRFQAGLCPAADPGCVTTVGYQQTQRQSGLGQIYVTAFTAQEDDVDAHFGLRVAKPRVYLAVSGIFHKYNYLGYPTTSGVGFGIEKLPDFDSKFSVYGSAFYYPRVSGKYTYPSSAFLGALSGRQITLAYSEWKYEIGGALSLGGNLYLDFGYAGARTYAKSNAPSGTNIGAPYVGLGLHF